MIGQEVSPLRPLVRPGLVRADVRAADATEVLREIAKLLAAVCPGCGEESILSGLRERERLGTTAVGGECAIPHVRLAALRDTVLAVARTESGVEFGAADGHPVRLFFGLAVPAGAASAHLRALAAVARWLKEPGHRDELLAAPDASAMLEVLGAA